MFVRYYGLLLALAASLSLTLSGCGSRQNVGAIDPATGRVAAAPQKAPDDDDTDQTIFTVLGLAKRASQREIGPQTGDTVSPELWQAALDTLNFAGIESEDPITGLVVTKWYSPTGKSRERLRVSAFVQARALRSDSVAISVERQEAGPDGRWKQTPVAREVVTDLEGAILTRARQIHAERYRNTMYN